MQIGMIQRQQVNGVEIELKIEMFIESIIYFLAPQLSSQSKTLLSSTENTMMINA